MNSTILNTKDAQTIKRTYAFFQILNLVFYALVLIAGSVLTIYFSIVDDIVIGLMPLGAMVFFSIIFPIIYNMLQIKFGMYYDIRMTRIAAEKGGKTESESEDVLPEL